MTIQLIIPHKKYLPSVHEAVTEYKSAPSEFEIGNVTQLLKASENNFISYFQDVENDAMGINLKHGYVPQTVFWLVDNNQYIGSFALRHRLTPALEEIGGHIAYQIRPSKQRQGYATQGLKLCLFEAFKMGIKEALITCRIQNTASYGVMHKVMLEYGGHEATPFKKEDIIEKRVWIKTK